MAVLMLRPPWSMTSMSNVTLQCLKVRNISSYTCSHKYDFSRHLNNELHDYQEKKLFPFRIESLVPGQSFSKATWKGDYFINDGMNLRYFELEDIFSNGFQCLNEYSEKSAVETHHLAPLTALKEFYEGVEKHEIALGGKSDTSMPDIQYQVEVAAILANHLLSPLVYKKGYKITNGYSKRPKHCPCFDTSCKKTITYGPTTLGCAHLFYGNPDVVLLQPSELSVMVQYDEEKHKAELGEEEKSNNNEKDICEIEEEKNSFRNWFSQAMAQCVTFSFYQRNAFNKQVLVDYKDVTLIPSLVLTLNNAWILMYDYKHDILLSSFEPTPLWKEGKLNWSCIFQIWMVLNHVLFMPSLTVNQNTHFKYSANIHTHIDKYMPETREIAFRYGIDSIYDIKPLNELGKPIVKADT